MDSDEDVIREGARVGKGPEEMAQWSKALAALCRGPGLGSQHPHGSHNCQLFQFQGSDALS